VAAEPVVGVLVLVRVRVRVRVRLVALCNLHEWLHTSREAAQGAKWVNETQNDLKDTYVRFAHWVKYCLDHFLDNIPMVAIRFVISQPHHSPSFTLEIPTGFDDSVVVLNF
jgi:hypothetical protein